MERIEIRSPNPWMTKSANRWITLIIGNNEDDVRLGDFCPNGIKSQTADCCDDAERNVYSGNLHVMRWMFLDEPISLPSAKMRNPDPLPYLSPVLSKMTVTRWP